jgi:DNA-binding XRE family transcriptional regulator
MNKKLKHALINNKLVDFDQLFNKFNIKKKEKILTRVRYLQAALALRKLRQQLNLSQEHLAIKMKVEREYISRIESGRQNITLETLYRIAEATDKEFILQFK